MTTLSHRLDRSLVIRAQRDTVFAFFRETPRWAAWWGPGSTIDPQPGGRVFIRHPGGVEVCGTVLEVHAPERIVFTYGFESGAPFPPEDSQVTIRLDRHPQGTLLQLTHEFASAEARNEHVQGWRFQLSLFANVIANTVNAEATSIVDQWFTAWGEPDADARERALAAIASTDIRVEDRFSCLEGLTELQAHLTATRRFMPGLRLQRRGGVRHCQWHVLADWVATAGDGQERGQGTNLFVLDSSGRIASVTGFWSASER